MWRFLPVVFLLIILGGCGSDQTDDNLTSTPRITNLTFPPHEELRSFGDRLAGGGFAFVDKEGDVETYTTFFVKEDGTRIKADVEFMPASLSGEVSGVQSFLIPIYLSVLGRQRFGLMLTDKEGNSSPIKVGTIDICESESTGERPPFTGEFECIPTAF